MRRLACFAPVALSALLASACSSSGSTLGESVRTTRQPIINGTLDTSANDAVVMILLTIDEAAGEIGACSGTVIAPHVIVTARHCVSQLTSDSRSSPVGADYATSILTVYTGVTPNVFSVAGGKLAIEPPQATVKQLVHDDATSLSNHDFAILVTNEALTVPPRAVRTANSAASKVGESLYAVGYGLTEADSSQTAEGENELKPSRHIRQGVAVEFVGPQGTELGSSEMVVGESVCEGDSGGGFFDTTTNALVANTSGGGNGDAPDAANPVLTCEGSTEENIITLNSGFLAQIQTALAVNCETATDEDGSTIYGTGCATTGSDAGTDTGTSTGADSGTDTGTSTTDDAATGTGTADGATGGAGTGSTKSSGGGCAVATTSASSTGSMFAMTLGALFGLSMLRRRRG